MAKLQRLFAPERDFYDYMKSFQSEHWFIELEGSCNKTTKYHVLKGVKEGIVELTFRYSHDNLWDGTGTGTIILEFRPLQDDGEYASDGDAYAIYYTGRGIDGFKNGAEKFLLIKRTMLQLPDFLPLQEFLSKLEERGIELGMHA